MLDNTCDDFATLEVTEMFEGTRVLRFPRGVARGLVGAAFSDETFSPVLGSTSVTVYASYRYNRPEHSSIPVTDKQGAVELYSISYRQAGYGQSF